jgi:hypothetical protein
MTEGEKAPEGSISVFDGVGLLRRGDTLLIVYQKPARVARTRWLFDRVDDVLASTNLDLLAFMIVLPTSDPPDGATRQENLTRLRRISHRVRRLVTTPIGNSFQVSLVRTIMRGLTVILGHAANRFITDTVEEGLTQLLEAKSAKTPPASELLADIGALYVALGEPEPKFPKARPGSLPSIPPGR